MIHHVPLALGDETSLILFHIEGLKQVRYTHLEPWEPDMLLPGGTMSSFFNSLFPFGSVSRSPYNMVIATS